MVLQLMDREINVWKDLRHPNIVGFYGACSIHDPPFMVCEYKANGDALKYLRKYPDANRIQLVCPLAFIATRDWAQLTILLSLAIGSMSRTVAYTL